MDYRKSFNRWIKHFSKNKQLLSELEAMETNENEIISGFSSELKFGTAGLRGIMGLGPNRLNIYTVRKATQGLANYLLSRYSSVSVVISFDSRINSKLFAQEAAAVIAGNGIKAFITSDISPTPFLSFAVRELKCQAGIMITASHNPSEYNGYKCYDENGTQMTSENTELVYEHIKKLDIFDDIKCYKFIDELKNGNINTVPKKIHEKYINKILEQSINKEYPKKCEIKVTYTPLNGAGKLFVEEALSNSGVTNLDIVKEQAEPDGNFTTCKYPNPEIEKTFELAVKSAIKNSSDIIIATDPDSDRVGLKVLHKGIYHMLTGNQIGILLFNYLISQKEVKNLLSSNPIAIRTLVSSKMIDTIAKDYGCKIWCVPTGFKNIGQKIFELEKNNLTDSFLFGFEESNGYLTGTYTRDKDAVSASLLLCEMTSFYKEKNLTLIDVLDGLYEKYGFYMEKTISLDTKTVSPSEKNKDIINKLKYPSILSTIGNKKVVFIKDYKNSCIFSLENNLKTDLDFPKLDIVEFVLSDNSSIIIRPSGTEPKIKIYIMTCGKSKDSAKLAVNLLEKDFCLEIQKYLNN